MSAIAKAELTPRRPNTVLSLSIPSSRKRTQQSSLRQSKRIISLPSLQPSSPYSLIIPKLSLKGISTAISDALGKSNSERRLQTRQALASKLMNFTKTMPEPEDKEIPAGLVRTNVYSNPACLNLRLMGTARKIRDEVTSVGTEREEEVDDFPIPESKLTERDRKATAQKAFSAIKHFMRLNLSPDQIPKLKFFVPKGPLAHKDSFHFMMACRQGDVLEVSKFLQMDRWLVLECDQVGETGLHWAARRDHIKVLELLVRYGAFLDAKDALGRTPLFLAAQTGNIASVRALLSHKANPFLRSFGNHSPVSVAENIVVEKLLMRSMQLAILLKFAAAGMKKAVWEKEGLAFFAADVHMIKRS